MEAGALSYGMGAGVGAAAATYLHRLFQNPADGTLQLTLNGVFLRRAAAANPGSGCRHRLELTLNFA